MVSEAERKIEIKARQLAELAGMRWDWISESMRQMFRANAGARTATMGGSDEA